MNLNELSKMSDKEIIDSITRTVGTPIEKALQAELLNRSTIAMNSLSTSIRGFKAQVEQMSSVSVSIEDFKVVIEKLNQSIRGFTQSLIFLAFVIAVLTGIMIYYISIY